MKLLLGFLFAGSVFFCNAQKISDPVLFGNTIRAENLKTNLYQIAGPEFEGRETATPGQQKAAGFIENYFRNLGLTPGNKDSFQYSFPVYIDSLESSGIQINGQDFQVNADYANRSLANLYTTSFGVSTVVFAGYGLSDSLQDDYQGLDVTGKIVLILGGFPPGYIKAQIGRGSYRATAKADAAMRHGAVAILSIQSDFPRQTPPESEKMYRSYFRRKLDPNFFYVSERIARKVMGNDYDKALLGIPIPKTYPADIWIHIQKKTSMLLSSDVVGYLEGSDLRDQLLIISAHYDHLGKVGSVIYYGADDDGSGTASLLEIAGAFSRAKSSGMGPRRSILFLANSGEEKGLFGSEYYTDRPLYPLDKTTADLNMDMIGRKDPGRKQGDSNNYVYIVGDDKLSSQLHGISEEMNKKYTRLELDYTYNNPNDPQRIFTRSDHYNFARKGVPIIFYFDGIHPDYHRPSDTPDKINYELLAKRVQLVFYTAWEMANRNDMLKRDLPPVTPKR